MMLVKDFADKIAVIAKEVACDGKGSIGSHKLPSRVIVWSVDDDDSADYELVGVDVSMLPGCGCWDGIILQIRKSRDAAQGESK